MPKSAPKTIAFRVNALCLAAAAVLFFTEIANWIMTQRLVESLDATRTIATAVRNHTIVDMVHDGLRSTVYSAFAAEELGLSRDDVEQDLTQYIATLDKMIGENKNLALSEESRKTLDGVERSLSDYKAATKAIVAAAFKNRAEARQMHGAFAEKFSALEKSLGEVGDNLEREASDISVLARKSRSQSTRWASLIFALVLGSVAGLSLFVRRSLLTPFGEQVAAIKSLSEGEILIEINGTARQDEVGDMARSIIKFRDTILEKRRHESEAAEARALADEESRRIGELQARTAAEQSALISTLGDALARLANGDLTIRLESHDNDAYRQIMSDFNATIDKLRETVGVIDHATQEVNGATHEISASATDLSDRTASQASSLEETSASMEQLAATVRQNASNAHQASEMAGAARDLAVKGNTVADQAVSAMSKIERSAGQISDIVSLIEDIAFQTNILALNAAVEAARAGDAGRGFGVVAGEVRALSQRAAHALKDVKSLIGESTSGVSEGVALVRQAGSALGEIVGSAKRVAVLVSEIASASEEQASGIAQVSQCIAQMDEMTQRNVELVQGTNSILHATQGQIEELRSAVAKFKTSGGRSSPVLSRSLEKRASPPLQARRAS